jgi:hypothetical protein
VAQRRERDANDEEDRREGRTREEQEARVLKEPARVRVKLKVVGHRRKRGRPGHGVAGEHQHRARDPTRPDECRECGRPPVLSPREQAPQGARKDEEGQRRGGDQEEGADFFRPVAAVCVVVEYLAVAGADLDPEAEGGDIEGDEREPRQRR